MFGVDSSEFLLILLVAIVVIGPKDLPRVMRKVGHWVGKARGMANQFRSGMDQMVRDSEIADLEQKWREQNESIMRANPLAQDSGWGLPVSPEPVSLEKGDDAAAEPSAPLMLEKPAEPSPAPRMLDKPVTSAPTEPRRRPIVPPLIKPASAVPRADAGGGAA